MSINALKDLNSLPASESKNDDSSRGCFTKPCNGKMLKRSRGRSLLPFMLMEGVEGIKTCGIDRLIQVAASQLSGQLPESRDAAQTLLLELQTVYKKSCCLLSATVHEHPKLDSWEHFCQSKISPLSTQAVLRVTNTNVAREGLFVSS
ncbi:hypothetical protein SLEP1_g10116 [Rubroshorea leprosula]|uniref:Uncharacterized protein n=1 Tax=Rubroshorea leprosula TaxID=152421 RepID=A0AAV5ICZ7_9ROSI|nr:hypothetical protein SLEP1_g10116 [Rubroshorea leprosula]